MFLNISRMLRAGSFKSKQTHRNRVMFLIDAKDSIAVAAAAAVVVVVVVIVAAIAPIYSLQETHID